MTEMPATIYIYIVSVFEASHWRTILTTTDIAEALRCRRGRRIKVADDSAAA